MMKKRIFALSSACLILCLSALLAGCAEEKEPVETLKVPVVAPLTGPMAIYGEEIKNGALLKAEQINAAGGVLGKRVDIILRDDRCEAKQAALTAIELAGDPEVMIVIGHVCSSATISALPIYKEAGLPAISPTSTNPLIGMMSPFYFRNVYTDDFQAVFLARYAREAMGWERIAVFYENNDYSIGLKDAFLAEAGVQGLEIMGEVVYTSETEDFSPMLARFKKDSPDAIFIPGYAPQATMIISQAARTGMDVGFFGADGLDEDIMLENPDAEGLVVTIPFLADMAGPEADAFIDTYTEKFDRKPKWYAANTYDAVGLALEAIEAAAGDREKIRSYLAGLNTQARAYHGVTGLTFFDGNGDCLKSAFVKTIREGRWVGAERQLR